MATKIKVLVVDDEERFGQNMVKILEANGLEAKAVESGEDALDELAAAHFDVVLLDMKMPGLGGRNTLKEIKRNGYQSEVVVLTGHASVNDAVDLLNEGAYDYLLKPCKTEKLLKMIGLANEQCRVSAQEPS